MGLAALLCGSTGFPVTLSSLWRVHLIYAKRDGKELLDATSHQYATLSTMISLLIATQMAMLFSNAGEAGTVRDALASKEVGKVAFWAGIFLFLGPVCSISALMAILTGWSINVAIGSRNAHAVLRSSLYLYARSRPTQLALLSIYIFVITVALFFFVVATWQVAMPVTIVFGLNVLHLNSLYNVVGQVIMYSGALKNEHIVERDVEYELLPSELTSLLLKKANIGKDADIPAKEQYRIKYQEQLKVLEEGGSLRLDEFRLPAVDYLGPEYGSDDGNYNESKED